MCNLTIFGSGPLDTVTSPTSKRRIRLRSRGAVVDAAHSWGKFSASRRIYCFIPSLCKIGLIAGAFDPHTPLRPNLMIPVFQISQCRKSQLDCYRGYRSEHAISNCLIEWRRWD
jgi:hypothetical protein